MGVFMMKRAGKNAVAQGMPFMMAVALRNAGYVAMNGNLREGYSVDRRFK